MSSQEINNTNPAIDAIWKRPENRILRQFFACVVLIGLDTRCETGAVPLIYFDYADPSNPDPKKIVAVIAKTVVNLLKLYSSKFKHGIHGAVTTFWRKLALLEHTSKISVARSKAWALMFPFTPYASDNVVTISLDMFIEYMRAEYVRTTADLVLCSSFVAVVLTVSFTDCLYARCRLCR